MLNIKNLTEESSEVTIDGIGCLLVEEGVQVLDGGPFQLESLLF